MAAQWGVGWHAYIGLHLPPVDICPLYFYRESQTMACRFAAVVVKFLLKNVETLSDLSLENFFLRLSFSYIFLFLQRKSLFPSVNIVRSIFCKSRIISIEKFFYSNKMQRDKLLICKIIEKKKFNSQFIDLIILFK